MSEGVGGGGEIRMGGCKPDVGERGGTEGNARGREDEKGALGEEKGGV